MLFDTYTMTSLKLTTHGQIVMIIEKHFERQMNP
jgi:hypothetical protein